MARGHPQGSWLRRLGAGWTYGPPGASERLTGECLAKGDIALSDHFNLTSSGRRTAQEGNRRQRTAEVILCNPL
jgi:hypothetical protein